MNTDQRIQAFHDNTPATDRTRREFELLAIIRELTAERDVNLRRAHDAEREARAANLKASEARVTAEGYGNRLIVVTRERAAARVILREIRDSNCGEYVQEHIGSERIAAALGESRT